jgi:hypothetical protein
MKKILISLSVFFIGFSFAANDTSSSISGSVNVPGATITVEHVPTGSTKSSTANDSGNFNFSGLRPGGPYVVTASAAGFNTERVDNVYLTLAESNSFDVVLVSSSAIEDVVVTGVRSGIVSSGPGSTITEDDIALTASIDKGLGDFLKRDSRFAVQGSFRDVQISALGANNRYNNFTIDGVAANDPLGLNANGFASVRNPISVETLAQIRVDFAPYSVTKGNFGGANINAVTKSGTNEFSGKVYGYETDQDNVGDVNGEPINQFADETKGFVFGGPIIEDKMFFFVGYEESERFSPSNSQPIAAEDEAELLQIKDFLMQRYNYDAGWPIFNAPPESQEQTLVKLDYNVNDNHRLEFIYQDTQDINIREYDRPNLNYVFSSHYYVYPIDRQKETISYIGDLSDDLSVEAKYTGISYKNDQDSLGGENFGHHRITLQSGEYVYPTSEQYRSANETNIDEDILNLKATLLRGNHTISVGYDYHEKFVSNLFIAFENGRWRWDSVDDFVNGNLDGLNTLLVIKPVDGNLMTGAAIVDIEMSTFYIEDVVDVSDILTLNFGVRVDSIDQPRNVGSENAAFEALAGFSNTTPLDSQVIQPRFGYKLDISDTKLISGMDRIEGAELSGGIGIFSGRVPQVWMTNPAANTGVATVFAGSWMMDFDGIDIRDYYDGLNLQALLPDSAANEYGPNSDLSAYAGAGPAVANHPDFNVPSDLKMSIDLDLYLRGGARLSMNYIKSEVQDAVNFTDLGVENSDVVQVAADGRTIYSEEYTQNIVMSNTSKGGMEAFTMSIDKQFDNGINAFASYTNTDSDSLWDGSQARAQSLYRGTARADALTPSLGESAWNTDHRLIAGLDYVMNEGSNRATTFSLFWNAQSGRPYSYTWRRYSLFDYDDNVLAYIPGANDPNVVYSGISEAAVLSHIEKLGLSDRAGSIAPRNIGNGDYYRSLDMRIAQEIPGFMDDDKFVLYFDAVNVLNFFNDSDGVRYFKGSTQEILETDGLDAEGRWIITGVRDETSFVDFNSSSYRFQLGFSYEF